MNYRHAYHAGGFADCFKHALLVALVDSLARKPSPYFVLDTHAGAGWYDLDAEPSRRTAEANKGIKRLLQSPASALARYVNLVMQLGLYPGSPALIRAVLRSGDRLSCCELHSEDAKILRRRFRHDPRVDVHVRSGREALSALLPPKEKRGLVFVDPPFEAQDEFPELLAGLRTGHSRFGHGIFALWYPIKQLAAIHELHAGLRSSGIRDIITVELCLRNPRSSDRLNGCGLAVINPPYKFDCDARSIAAAILDRLGDDERGAGTALVRLADE